MKNLKTLQNKLRLAAKYNNKSRAVKLVLEIARYSEPKAKSNPENTQVATTAKYYSDIFTFLLNAINAEIAKVHESQPVVTPARDRAVTLYTEIFMACYTSQKIAIARKLGIRGGSAKQLSWVVDILREHQGWVINAIEQNLLPTDIQYLIKHAKDLSQQALLDPEVVF